MADFMDLMMKMMNFVGKYWLVLLIIVVVVICVVRAIRGGGSGGGGGGDDVFCNGSSTGCM